ncbi:helix-hairpin-helix domain-containing protein [Chromobacterium sphagni]|uniref:Mitomycin resistance protein n=1 Tax=Chromobacterium sphagni TaxID=1903179 RepID=A0A1S1WTX6_9NEIS|nr:helix-hairpin-helix domain-containing protein [Chromobacterium sphagni]OHX10694.1 mitomycin resistance protein [Chromobacterium sphagni]OHX18923.1 mitomycin resistance protein [Chromobacterium sphagni]
MHPSRCPPPDLALSLLQLPNVGPRTAADLELLGIRSPQQLRGRDPYQLYLELCDRTGQRQDPCVLDMMLSVCHYVDTGEARAWWSFTPERKRKWML